MKIRWKVLIISFIAAYLAAGIGSIFTSAGVKSDWYQEIKPGMTPPNWVFPVVWGILFFLIALSLYFSVIKAGKKMNKVLLLFGVNFLLNILWSVFYFGMRNPGVALIDLILIEISTLSIMSFAWKIDRKASWLLIPYFLWVLFAGILNYMSIA